MSIFHAIQRRDVAAVQRQLAEDKSLVYSRELEGLTPLHMAAHEGDLQIMKLLLEVGADLESRTRSGATPLHCAVSPAYKYSESAGRRLPVRQSLEATSFLLGWGADPTARDNSKKTALHWAASHPLESECAELVQALAAAGGDVNARDDLGRTPLHLAADTLAAIPDAEPTIGVFL